MRLLAIDTASEACSVGVAADRVLTTRSEVVGRGHAEILMGMIEKAMAEAGLAFVDLERIAVTVGPGSFTGLRIGIAAARGFALVTGAPAVGIGVLAVHAEEARTTRGAQRVLAVLQAGRGDMYGALYAPDGGELEPAAVGSPVHFAALAAPGTIIAGSGADLIAALVPGASAHIAHRHASPDIAAFCRLAERAPAPAASPRPLYLRAPDAKPQASAVITLR